MTINYKKIFSTVLVLLVAIVTGFSIGKIYLDSTTTTTAVVLETQKELQEDEKAVKSLYDAAVSGKSVESFNGMQLYQIAEYKLNHTEIFLKEMLGEVISTGQTAILKGQKYKDEKGIVFYKLSPAKKIMAGLSTPNICTRVVCDNKTQNQIRYSIGDASCFLDVSSKENLDAKLTSAKVDTYAQEQYLEKFKTTPKDSFLYYIISSKTCAESDVSEIRNNLDGTYSFDISLSGTNLNKAALHYTLDVLNTCGYGNPSLSWNSVDMTVTIDSAFNFKTITYIEKYQIASEDIPVLKKAGVEDRFVDYFYFDQSEILSHALTDYKVLRGLA